MSFSFLPQPQLPQTTKPAPAEAKKRSAKSQSVGDTLDCITAKLSTLGISKLAAHKSGSQITLSDGTKIVDTAASADGPRNCNWCKNLCADFRLGIPLWMGSDAKAFAIEEAFCSLNCCLAFLNYTNSSKYKDSLGLFHLLTALIGVDSHEIFPAEHWTKQKDFGGRMEREEYRAGWIHLSPEQEAGWKQLTLKTHKLVVL